MQSPALMCLSCWRCYRSTKACLPLVPLEPSPTSVWYALDPPVARARAGHGHSSEVSAPGGITPDRPAGSRVLGASEKVREESDGVAVSSGLAARVQGGPTGRCTPFASRGRPFPFPPLAIFGEWDLAALRFRPHPSRQGTLCWAANLTSSHAASCLSGRHIVFVGDSTTRYQYIALIHFLHTGAWPAETPVNATKNPMHHIAWVRLVLSRHLCRVPAGPHL